MESQFVLSRGGHDAGRGYRDGYHAYSRYTGETCRKEPG
jgi:hypothetical protein